MGDYLNFDQNEYWNQPNQTPNQSYYEQDFNQFSNQQLGMYMLRNYFEMYLFIRQIYTNHYII